MRGATNSQKSNLPRNGVGYHIIQFGGNKFDGYYRGWIAMPNADKVTIQLLGMGVIGQSWWVGSELESKTQVFTDAWGVYINCNDDTVVGMSCNPQLLVSGGGCKLISRILSFFGRCRR